MLGTGGVVGSGGVLGTGGVGASGGHPQGGGGAPGSGGAVGADCDKLAKQYTIELQTNARTCNVNALSPCAIKMPSTLTCLNPCITWVEDSTKQLRTIQDAWETAGCARTAPKCTVICDNPSGATCKGGIIITPTEFLEAVVAPIQGTCQDDNVRTPL